MDLEWVENVLKKSAIKHSSAINLCDGWELWEVIGTTVLDFFMKSRELLFWILLKNLEKNGRLCESCSSWWMVLIWRLYNLGRREKNKRRYSNSFCRMLAGNAHERCTRLVATADFERMEGESCQLTWNIECQRFHFNALYFCVSLDYWTSCGFVLLLNIPIALRGRQCGARLKWNEYLCWVLRFSVSVLGLGKWLKNWT